LLWKVWLFLSILHIFSTIQTQCNEFLVFILSTHQHIFTVHDSRGTILFYINMSLSWLFHIELLEGLFAKPLCGSPQTKTVVNLCARRKMFPCALFLFCDTGLECGATSSTFVSPFVSLFH
jgi:hypothetical protein